jgi:hypothetical protein
MAKPSYSVVFTHTILSNSAAARTPLPLTLSKFSHIMKYVVDAHR